MTKIIGFGGAGEEPLKELETGEGWKFLETDKEPFPNETDRYVALHVGNATIYGVYRGINDRGFFVLLPHVNSEFIPFLREQTDKGIRRFYWEKTRPKYVNPHAVVGLSPVRKEYLDDIVRGRNLENKKRKRVKVK